jgi:hypothetical protein
LLAVNEALEKFAALEPRKAELVKLRYFVGMSFDEAATPLGIAPRPSNGGPTPAPGSRSSCAAGFAEADAHSSVSTIPVQSVSVRSVIGSPAT